MASGQLLDEVDGEGHDVFAALAQGRDLERYHAQPVEQVGAEAALLEHLLQRAVGCGEEADIDGAGPVLTHERDRPILESAEQLGLGGRGEIPPMTIPITIAMKKR